MIFARNGESANDVAPQAAPAPTGETQDYCQWAEREVAPRPEDRRRAESHASLDFDDEDVAWTALLDHARTLGYQARDADEWDAILAELDEETDQDQR